MTVWTRDATAIRRNGDPTCPQCHQPWQGNHVWALGTLPICQTPQV